MRNLIAIPMGLTLVLTLAGCLSGPDYQRPEVLTPDQWRDASSAGVTRESVVESRWWESLGDATLSELVRRVEAGNIDLRVAEARVREARAARGIAGAALWPLAGASASYRIERGPEVDMPSDTSVSGGVSFGPGGLTRTGTVRGRNVTVSRSVNAAGATTGVTVAPGGASTPDRTQDLFSAGFDAAWELDIFGGTRRAIEAADADVAAAQEWLRALYVSLASEVALNYVDLRASQRRLDITRRNIESQRDTLRLTKARFEAGLSSEFDAARAEAQLANTESQVPRLEADIQTAIHRLGVLSGESPAALESILVTAAPIPAAPQSIPAGLPSDLLLRRPDIRAAERELAAATARVGVAVADLYPKFTLTGALTNQSIGLGSGMLDAANRVWNIGPGASWPIFDAGRIHANIAVQNARQQQSLARYEQSILLALEEVENALVGFVKEQERRTSLQAAVDANQRAVRLANERYNKGLEDFLSVLTAQAQVFAAEDLLVQSESAVLLNLLALYKALGGGWEQAYPEPAPDGESPASE